ncbi:TPA: SipW-dependent-type signal peptide-containing protein [Enterococcus faecium]
MTAITLLLVTIGSTYAWWTASTQVEQKVTMRNLAIEASFAPQDHTNYEPGTYAKIE